MGSACVRCGRKHLHNSRKHIYIYVYIYIYTRIQLYIYIYIYMFSSPVVPSPPNGMGPSGGGGGGGPIVPPPPPQGAGACGAVCASVRTTLRARLRLWSCVALQCDLLISQHATSCSAVASDSARCHDAVCGLQRRSQVLTKCAATRQWQTHFPAYYRPQPPFPQGGGRCGNHGHTVLPSVDPSPHPSHRGWGGLRSHCATILPKKVGTMDPPHPSHSGVGGLYGHTVLPS